MSASVLVCMLNTHSNQRDVANIGKAKNSFNVSIHFPGRGMEDISSGFIDKTKYGAAKPKPKDKKIGRVIADG